MQSFPWSIRVQKLENLGRIIIYNNITVTLDHEVCENFSITYCKGIANSLQK